MENKAHALAAGIFVVAITALLLMMALWLTRDVTNTVSYEITSDNAVTGLQVQATVRYRGVNVGKVTAIGFDPTTRGNVLIKIAVSPNTPITRSTYAQLTFQSIAAGQTFVQLDDDGHSTEPPALGPDGPPRIPLRPNAFGQLSDQAGELLVKIGEATERINKLLGQDNQEKLTKAIAAIGTTADDIGQLARTADRTLRTQLDPARTDLSALVRQAGATLKATEEAASETRRSMAAIGATTQDLRQSLVHISGPGGTLDRVDQGLGILATSTLPRLGQLTDDTGRAVRRIDLLANLLGENPQALLYGNGPAMAGPGEPGFVAPGPLAAPAHAETRQRP